MPSRSLSASEPCREGGSRRDEEGGALTARATGVALGLDGAAAAALGVLAIAAVLEGAVGRGTTAISTLWWEWKSTRGEERSKREEEREFLFVLLL